MNEPKLNDYKIQCTIPTLILMIILYTFFCFMVGLYFGDRQSRQTLHIEHYHAEDASFPVLQGDYPLETKPQNIPVKKRGIK